MLLWQFVSIVALAILIVVGGLITKWIFNGIQRRRERLMYEQLYGAPGVNNNVYLGGVIIDDNGVIMTDPLLLDGPMSQMPHDVMPLVPRSIIMNESAVNNSQDNILKVNSMGAVIFPDSFWDEENNDFEEQKESYMGHESHLMIDDIEKDLAQIAQYDFRIRRKTLADIWEESGQLLVRDRKKSF
jgi:hypothetical protein